MTCKLTPNMYLLKLAIASLIHLGHGIDLEAGEDIRIGLRSFRVRSFKIRNNMTANFNTLSMRGLAEKP